MKNIKLTSNQMKTLDEIIRALDQHLSFEKRTYRIFGLNNLYKWEESHLDKLKKILNDGYFELGHHLFINNAYRDWIIN